MVQDHSNAEAAIAAAAAAAAAPEWMVSGEVVAEAAAVACVLDNSRRLDHAEIIQAGIRLSSQCHFKHCC